MSRSLIALAALALAACNDSKPTVTPASTPSAAAKSAAPKSAAPKSAAPTTKAATPVTTAAPQPAAVKAGPVAKLPAADRVFTGGGRVLGAMQDKLWAATPKPDGSWHIDWIVQGPGVAQKVVYNKVMQGEAYIVAWGVGRGFLQAPLVLMQHTPDTGKAQELWRNAGARNECAHLSVAHLDGDLLPDIAFAYYSSKYMVKSRNLLSSTNGKAVEGVEIRMASSRAYGDLDGDKKPDEAIGRVYGDAKGVPGDLTVNFGNGKTWKVPTDRGVKAVWIGTAGSDGKPALYFADGWEANYGKLAKAQLKRVEANGEPKQIGISAGEFTFFDIEAADLDGDGKAEIIARGNKALSRFEQGSDGTWNRTPLAGMQPVLNAAVGKTPTGWNAYIPTNPRTPGVPIRVVPLKVQ